MMFVRWFYVNKQIILLMVTFYSSLFIILFTTLIIYVILLLHPNIYNIFFIIFWEIWRMQRILECLLKQSILVSAQISEGNLILQINKLCKLESFLLLQFFPFEDFSLQSTSHLNIRSQNKERGIRYKADATAASSNLCIKIVMRSSSFWSIPYPPWLYLRELFFTFVASNFIRLLDVSFVIVKMLN